MSKKTTNKVTKVKAEVIKFNPMLDAEYGFTDNDLVDSIKNKTMQSAVRAYKNAVESGNKSAWNVAKACARMKLEARKEFENDEVLAHFLGLSNKNAFSRLYRLGGLANKAMELGLTTTPVTELLVLAGDKYGKLDPADHLDKIVGMTKDEVRDYVKKFKVAIEDKQKEEQEEGQEDKREEDDSIAGDTKKSSDDALTEWRAILSVNAEVMDNLADADRESLIYDLKGICAKYNINENDYWIVTKR